MARQNRCEVFDPNEVSVVHCINRAVRRAMLCGVDRYSGKSFEHRRNWVKDRLKHLEKHYGVDVLGYAIMGNHLHCILRNRPDVVKTWSDEEVARRIWFLFPKRKDKDGAACEPQQNELNMLMASKPLLLQYRERLSDISWLMRQLAEFVARKANKEDECTGRFWEGRFKCQPLLDEAAILACSAYVDLNPVRARIAETPEESDFTSAQDRIKSAKTVAKVKRSNRRNNKKARVLQGRRADSWLAPVYLNERAAAGPMPSAVPLRASDKGFLPMRLDSYLDLLDWTGRQIVDGKGSIPKSCQPILKRIGLAEKVWCELVEDFSKLFGRFAGGKRTLGQSAEKAGVGYRRSGGGPALLPG